MKLTLLVLAALVVSTLGLTGCRSAQTPQSHAAPATEPTVASLRAAADEVARQNPQLKGNSRWTYRHARVVGCEVKRNPAGPDPVMGLVRLAYDQFWQERQGGPLVFQVVFSFRGGKWVWIAAAEEREGHVYPFEGFTH